MEKNSYNKSHTKKIIQYKIFCVMTLAIFHLTERNNGNTHKTIRNVTAYGTNKLETTGCSI